MQKTKFKKFTPLCIAGKKKHGKVLDEFFKFFKKNNYIIKTIFDKDGPKKKKILDEFPQLYSEEVLDKKIELKNVDGKGFNNVQQLYLNLYYWAACYGDFEIVNIFLIDLGFSPFMKISSEQTPVHGAVLHLQERIFCYFVKNSSHGLPPVHKNVYKSSKCSLDDLNKNKYQCLNEKAWQTFAESR
jgi:ankyrin repeat protein